MQNWIVGAVIATLSLQVTILGLMGKIAYDIANRFGMSEAQIKVLAEQVRHLEEIMELERSFEKRDRDRGYVK
jgi:hypothetical protein